LQDEVVAVKDLESPRESFVIRADDFLRNWLVDDLKWNWGLVASYYNSPTAKLISSSNGLPVTSLVSNTKLDFSEIDKAKATGEFLRTNFISALCCHFLMMKFVDS